MRTFWCSKKAFRVSPGFAEQGRSGFRTPGFRISGNPEVYERQRSQSVLKINALSACCTLASTLQKESAAAKARQLQRMETTMPKFLFWSL
ncbi:hypothetical protein C2L65_01220 [Paraburkholderia terrae]|uniref:Uncharacterized protein n=1 Tax=Paraburkholderia terrae TaxID=311230 RepID=A0A2I8EFJ4_9BURK|nr:hypothetical protein C2L65_01220 [Paraburkholderia terrae]